MSAAFGPGHRLHAPSAFDASAARLGRMAAVVALLVLQAVLATTHAPWADESQAWQIAVFSPSWEALFANLRYEGHPVLWYALLRLVSVVSASPLAMAVVQAIVATATAALLLTRSPFPFLHRLALAGSYLLLFEYGTIARSYGIGVLLLVTFLLYRRRPLAWLLLALMANVSIHFLMLSAALVAALFFVENRRSWIGWTAWLVGCALSVWTMHPASDVMPVLPLLDSWPQRIKLLMATLDGLLLPADSLTFPLVRPLEPRDSGGFAGALALALFWLCLRAEKRLLAVGVGLAAATFALCLLVYPASSRHFGILFLFVIAADWLKHEAMGQPPSRFSRGWAMLGAVLGAPLIVSALMVPATNLPTVADWARKQGVLDAPWAVYPVHQISGLVGAFGRPIYDVRQDCLNRFTRWDRDQSTSHHDLIERLRRFAGSQGGKAFVLTAADGAPLQGEGIERIHVFPAALESSKAVYAVSANPSGRTGIAVCPWTMP